MPPSPRCSRTRIAQRGHRDCCAPAKELDDYASRPRHRRNAPARRLYRINDLKTGRSPSPTRLSAVHCRPGARRGRAAPARRGLAHGAAIANAARMQRDLGNLPPNLCTPSYLADQARALAKKYPSVKAQVLDEAGIRKEKMGCSSP